MKRRAAGITLTSALVLGAIGCDAQNAVARAMAKLGLNVLAVPNDLVTPGAVLLKKSGRLVTSDNVQDFVEPGKTLAVTHKYGSAVLPRFTDEAVNSADAAVSLVKSWFPADIGAAVSWKKSVKLESVVAKVDSVPVIQLETFMGASEGAPFARRVRAWMADGNDVYLVYQTLSANKLSLSAESGDEWTPSLKIGEWKELASGSVKVSLKRTAELSWAIEGDHNYVFAIRTGKVKASGNGFVIEPTGFSKAITMGGDDDDRYSAAPAPAAATLKDFGTLNIERGFLR